MNENQGGNPFQSSAVFAKLESLETLEWRIVIEFLVGTIFLLGISLAVYYYIDFGFGLAASGLVFVVVIRSSIDLWRKRNADCLQVGSTIKSLALSIFFVGVAAVAGYVTFFATCISTHSLVEDRLRYQVQYGDIILFCVIVGAAVASVVVLALLYFLGPASVDRLNMHSRQAISPQSIYLGNEPSDHT
ncbi:hypothetical protein [Blastopirellula marina]|uniref:Transmembrane protein n=1 Tax=Blastopirellula marina DSM 3645 TaxID=314230 RepID=A3ZQF1_9BACT|nr:hypothetical protein [Blastopirellula marina]EAQ81427.1 hypothetical protein DSM3645_23586 [Blastopirellula marina DSM 3645]